MRQVFFAVATMDIFPIYLLQLGDEWKVIAPEDHQDVSHTNFWAQTVSHIVAKHYRISQKKLANLPYCQRRARIVGNVAYYGETPDPKLLRLLCESLSNPTLMFCYDEHEKRLQEDVRQFRR